MIYVAGEDIVQEILLPRRNLLLTSMFGTPHSDPNASNFKMLGVSA